MKSSSARPVSRGLFSLAIGSAFVAGAQGMSIIPNFDSSITTNGNAAAIEACLNQVCNYYDTTFADNITVHVTFHNTSNGLGSNNPATITVPYATFRSALGTDASTANDAVALAHLENQTNNPVDGTANVILTRPNARAIGLSADATVDDVINLNTAICFLDHSNPVSGRYDLYGVACHEMDECLGSVSGLTFGGTPWSADMFRYNGSGGRSYNFSTSQHAYLSLDGTTRVVEYNQFNRGNGDWGDWIIHNPAQVQDWAGSSGQRVDMGVSENTLLDAVGYDFAPVPEPATFAVLGMGGLLLLRRRAKA